MLLWVWCNVTKDVVMYVCEVGMFNCPSNVYGVLFAYIKRMSYYLYDIRNLLPSYDVRSVWPVHIIRNLLIFVWHTKSVIYLIDGLLFVRQTKYVPILYGKRCYTGLYHKKCLIGCIMYVKYVPIQWRNKCVTGLYLEKRLTVLLHTKSSPILWCKKCVTGLYHKRYLTICVTHDICPYPMRYQACYWLIS